MFFDFCAAFPSVAHAFIFIILETIKIPIGLLNFFRGLDHNNRCFADFGNGTQFLYDILSGIIQGCPASGTLFIIAVDPLLRMLKQSLPSATSRAFADDIGTLIQHLNQIPTIYACFHTFSKISNLYLKPKKCVAIPLGAPLTDFRLKQVSNYIAKISTCRYTK